MSTMYSRRAGRLLSLDRRSGLQVPRDVADGRAQRYQQNWSDQSANDDCRDPMKRVTNVLDAMIVLGLLAVSIGATAVVAVWLADWIGGVPR